MFSIISTYNYNHWCMMWGINYHYNHLDIIHCLWTVDSTKYTRVETWRSTIWKVQWFFQIRWPMKFIIWFRFISSKHLCGRWRDKRENKNWVLLTFIDVFFVDNVLKKPLSRENELTLRTGKIGNSVHSVLLTMTAIVSIVFLKNRVRLCNNFWTA